MLAFGLSGTGRLDHFEVIILDDLGYLKHRSDEAEVLFTLIAERYERRSLIVTSNMVFSQWEETSRARWPPPTTPSIGSCTTR